MLETYEDQAESNIEYDILDPADEKADEVNDHFVFYGTENETEEQEIPVEEVEVLPSASETPTVVERQTHEPKIDDPSSVAKNIIDPDERYLMSCLPAFKRFTPQQKAYVRMGIERLFYEVEFENVSEPKSKRNRMS